MHINGTWTSSVFLMSVLFDQLVMLMNWNSTRARGQREKKILIVVGVWVEFGIELLVVRYSEYFQCCYDQDRLGVFH